MSNPLSKPKLLFFQYQYDPRLPAFLLTHKDEHARCLSQFFEVTVIREDCDFQQVCDRYEPDIAFFESGVPNPVCRRIEIHNVRAQSSVYKLGFLHSDAFCCGRAGFLSDMDHWGIDTFFAIAATAPEHLPAIADRLFIWPNSADPEIYRDYGLWKSIPVLFTGNKSSMYPWRRQIIRTVAEHYPSMICPHPGYSPTRNALQAPVGEPYARLLNSAWFVPACGTVAREVVRKHFEVPASNACLVTEGTPLLTAAGFIDMVNCVFADSRNVLDKLDSLFKNPDVLTTIIANGHKLVHEAHVPQRRSEVLQWFRLKQALLPHQRIVQSHPFSGLSVADTGIGGSVPVISNGHHLVSLQQGDREMEAGRYPEAEAHYLKCASYIGYMPEPKLRLAVSYLHRGKPERALASVSEPLQFTLAEYKAVDPDPVEWAFLIVTLLCLGKVDEALRRSREFPSLRHAQLELARFAAALAAGLGPASPLPCADGQGQRPSLHDRGAVQPKEWLDQLFRMLRACGQAKLADSISDRVNSTPVATPTAPQPRLPAGLVSAHRRFALRMRYTRARARLKRAGRAALYALETRSRYFLPYHLSAARNDEFFQIVEDLAREEDLASALVITASERRLSSEALLAGVEGNPSRPPVYRLTSSLAGDEPPVRATHSERAEALRSSSGQQQAGAAVELTTLKSNHGIGSFDLILIEGSDRGKETAFSTHLRDELYNARFILLDDVNVMPNCEYHKALLARPDFVLKDYHPWLRNGYSVFLRDRHEHAATEAIPPILSCVDSDQ